MRTIRFLYVAIVLMLAISGSVYSANYALLLDGEDDHVIEKLKEGSEQGIEILAFPEGTLFGYCCRDDYWENAKLEWFEEAERRISVMS